jgi:DNA-binding transcriptional MerR regulator
MVCKISEFASLAYVSVRLLHHYDRLGLLRPVQVDRDNGYRYYSLEQLPALNRILALKNLGCSLEEIRHLLHANLSADDIQALLTIKRERLARQLAEEQRRLSLVEDYLASLRMEGRSPEFDILIKSTEPLAVLSVRQRIDPPRTRIPDIFREAHRCLRAGGLPLRRQSRQSDRHGDLGRRHRLDEVRRPGHDRCRARGQRPRLRSGRRRCFRPPAERVSGE